jgi:hypothetical protein
VLINEPFASGVVYPAVLAAWIYMAVFSAHLAIAVYLATAVFFVGFFTVLIFNLILDLNERSSESFFQGARRASAASVAGGKVGRAARSTARSRR